MTMTMATRSDVVCRLCGGPTDPQFHATVLGSHKVGYHQCQTCHSLQTDVPYWLKEAYAQSHLSRADSGAVARALQSQAIVYTIARILRLQRSASVLDFGGGSGLLCRLLRDIGFDARRSDAHAPNDFAQGFDDDGATTYSIVCAFEVVEHFAQPAQELPNIFNRAADLVVLGTNIYERQGHEWWYLSPGMGQHVFFYSADAMTHIARRFDFRYCRDAGVHIFAKRQLGRAEIAVLRRALRDPCQRWVRAKLAYNLTYAHVERDGRLFRTKHLPR
jgi:hypothetical protein